MDTKSRLGTVTIGAVSKRTGINIETIRYYERIGLVPKPTRSAGGYRHYEEADVRRLFFIRRSRQLGFSQDEIRSLLRLVDGGSLTCAEVKAITLNHLADLRERLRDIQKVERVLTEMAANCDGADVPACPVIDALYGEVEDGNANRAADRQGR